MAPSSARLCEIGGLVREQRHHHQGVGSAEQLAELCDAFVIALAEPGDKTATVIEVDDLGVRHRPWGGPG